MDSGRLSRQTGDQLPRDHALRLRMALTPIVITKVSFRYRVASAALRTSHTTRR
jgi:hypothetical protein